MKNRSFWLFSIMVIFVLACKQDLERSQWHTNPNGDSELALLMREMYDDVMMMKKDVLANKVPSVRVKHEDILVAQATEPEKVASQTYKDYANLYLKVVEAMKNTDHDAAVSHYNNLVNLCLSCHDSLCPGPKMKIKNLVMDSDS